MHAEKSTISKSRGQSVGNQNGEMRVYCLFDIATVKAGRRKEEGHKDASRSSIHEVESGLNARKAEGTLGNVLMVGEKPQ